MRSLSISTGAGAWCAGLIVALLAGNARAEPPLHRRTRWMMHTEVTVAIAQDAPEAKLDEAFEAAFAVFGEVERDLNEWRPGSPLAEVNRRASKEAVPAPPRLCEVLRLARDGAARTHGLFDPTWAALADVWRFGDDAAPAVPSNEAIAAACKAVDWRHLKIEGDGEGACKVRLGHPKARLGLGGLAKGWGVDRAVAKLRALGFRDFYVQAGGDLYLAGHHGEKPWRVGIRDPRGERNERFASVDVSDAAFSTSGDYEHFFILDGRRYHHLIDPRTCRPAPASRSATVLAKSATDAEILTKAIFILGGEKGLALAHDFGADAVIVDAEGDVHVSKALKPRITWRDGGKKPAPTPAR